MKLHGISATNFMSLRSFRVNDLDPRVNFIVGPNGSGKTTMFRLMRVIRDASAVVSRTDRGGNNQARDSFSTRLRLLRSQDASGQEMTLATDVEFDTPREQELLALFVSAALLHPESLKNGTSHQLQRQSPPDNTVPSEEQMTTISGWLLERLSTAALSPLYRGRLQLSFRPDVFERLELSYTFQCGGSPLSLACGWTPYYTDGYFSKPGVDNRVHANQTEDLLFEFVDKAEHENFRKLVSGQPTSGEPESLNVEELLCHLAEKTTLVMVRGVSQPHAYPPAHTRLAEMTGLPLRDPTNDRLAFSQLLHHLLSEALVFTSDLGILLPSKLAFDSAGPANQDATIQDQQQLASRLFYRKNGDFGERKKYRSIQQAFSNLAGMGTSFDVVAVSPDGLAPSAPDVNPALDLDVRITDELGEIPLSSNGAGISEALLLSTLLDDSDGRIVLLDEPASNLHPGMQRRMMDHLRTVPGQVFIVTHSQHLLPTRADEFTRVIRLSKPGADTLIYRLPAGGTRGLHSAKLEQELNSSSDVGGLLFASGVILVEGDTETAALSEWFPRTPVSRGKTLEDLGVALYAVGSKTNFGFYIRFLHAFGVPWAVICDGDALVSNNTLWSGLTDVGAVSAAPTTTDFSHRRREAATAGVFTANASATEKFESISEVQAYITNPTSGLPTRSKVRDGRQIGRSIACPPAVEEVLGQVLARFHTMGVPMPPITTP
jgi:energy-coupling factor transporter ATP-binding protein EcfA2